MVVLDFQIILEIDSLLFILKKIKFFPLPRTNHRILRSVLKIKKCYFILPYGKEWVQKTNTHLLAESWFRPIDLNSQMVKAGVRMKKYLSVMENKFKKNFKFHVIMNQLRQHYVIIWVGCHEELYSHYDIQYFILFPTLFCVPYDKKGWPLSTDLMYYHYYPTQVEK